MPSKLPVSGRRGACSASSAGSRRTASRNVTPDISDRCRCVQDATQSGSCLEISRSTQPMALRMKNSRSASSGSAYRVNRGRSGCPVRMPRSSASSADRRTQKSASAAHPSMTGHDRGSRSAISPATLTASPSTSAQVPDSRSSRSTVARSPARQPGRGQRQDLHRRHPALMDRRPPQRDRPGDHRGLVEPGVAPHRRPDHPPQLRHGHPEELKLALEVPLLLRGPVRPCRPPAARRRPPAPPPPDQTRPCRHPKAHGGRPSAKRARGTPAPPA